MNPDAGIVTMKNELNTTIRWETRAFDELGPAALYAIIRLRNEVFVVEQNCVFQDADNKDQGCFHLMGWANDELAAYTRIAPPGYIYTEASIGRVITAAAWRGAGLGRLLMQVSIQKTLDIFGQTPIRIGAQEHLLGFYHSLGFQVAGDVYLEDGIPHAEMLLEK